MAYVFVEDFKFGMDRRRPRHAGVPGTLWDAANVVLSRGGDIERAKRFVPIFEDLDGTFGLVELRGGFYVFGSADLAGSMPPGVTYQRLQAPNSPAMTAIVAAKKFDGKIYAVAEYDDGNRYHFYDGTRVTEWDARAAGITSRALVNERLAQLVTGPGTVTAQVISDGVILTALAPGTAFTVTAAAANGGGTNDQTSNVTQLQANVAGVAAVAATADIEITGGTFDPNVSTVSSVQIDSVELLEAPVSWTTSHAATANALSLAINERTAIHGYTSAPAGAVVTISAVPGAAANGSVLTVSETGDVTTTHDGTLTGGVDAVTAVAQVSRVTFGGTFEAADTFTITLNSVDYKTTGRAAGTGTAVWVGYDRVWSIAGPAVAYSKINDPTVWTTTATAALDPGIIVVSTDEDGAQSLTGLESYQGKLALFAPNAVLVYTIGTNPANFGLTQTLPNTGTVAGRAVRSYGSNDLFYLDSTGIRSLQARDSSNAAFVSDAGTAFDPYVQQSVLGVAPAVLERANAVLDPQTGAYWLAVGDEILVLTNYPGTKIRGWTRLTPGFDTLAMARTANRVILRDADTIYMYGGWSGQDYPLADEMVASVKLPFLTARDPQGFKQISTFDAGFENQWLVEALPNPNATDQKITLGRFSGVTYSKDNSDQIGETTHVALEFTCNKAGFASISNLAVGHEGSLRA